jgi:hypothetical protein
MGFVSSLSRDLKFAARWLDSARRAARVDPMAALREE